MVCGMYYNEHIAQVIRAAFYLFLPGVCVCVLFLYYSVFLCDSVQEMLDMPYEELLSK